MSEALPLPPVEMRALVGQVDPAYFDNPSGKPALLNIPPDMYRSVLDFGCGCGRLARQLMLQHPRPERYLGLDLHRGMVAWCQANLAPVDPAFRFEHHDVFSAGLNPGADKPWQLPIAVEDEQFTLVAALSVFTHLTESQTLHYLPELARTLVPGGYIYTTWFLFDKRPFPMMQGTQNALYINEYDLSNAVLFDREWLPLCAERAGLRIVHANAPRIRGFHWDIVMQRDTTRPSIELPPDSGSYGHFPPPAMPPRAEDIGLARDT